MESEALFLFVAYKNSPLPITRDEKGREVVSGFPAIRRAARKKATPGEAGQDGFMYKRTPIEFDPTQHQTGFVVIIYTQIEDGSLVDKTHFHFVTITPTAEEAEIQKNKIEKGGYKYYLENRQKFDRAEVAPILISEY